MNLPIVNMRVSPLIVLGASLVLLTGIALGVAVGNAQTSNAQTSEESEAPTGDASAEVVDCPQGVNAGVGCIRLDVEGAANPEDVNPAEALTAACAVEHPEAWPDVPSCDPERIERLADSVAAVEADSKAADADRK